MLQDEVSIARNEEDTYISGCSFQMKAETVGFVLEGQVS